MLHHRAVIRSYRYSETLGMKILAELKDVGFPWGTEWKDSETVMKEVNRMKKWSDDVRVDVRDAG